MIPGALSALSLMSNVLFLFIFYKIYFYLIYSLRDMDMLCA